MLVTMSNKELHRLSVIQAVIEKRLRRRDAASQLDLTEPQVQRLMTATASLVQPVLPTHDAASPARIALMKLCATAY